MKLVQLTLASCAALALTACSGPTSDNNSTPPGDNSAANSSNTNGGKGDTPDLESSEACTLRSDDVLKTGKPRFLTNSIRWPAGDVEGVNTVGRDDRGQEYTEYFAVVKTPDEAGLELQETGEVFGIPGQTPLSVELNDDQLFYLEDHPNEEVGSCVFTSWHKDITAPLPCDASKECPTVHGVEMTPETFRMKIGFNSNGAASDLVQQCFSRTKSGEYGAGNTFENEFFRGCMLVADIYGTEWRSSDPQICASAMRLAECGCKVTEDPGADLGLALVPPPAKQEELWGGIGLRGFELGTWSDPNALPGGCEYIDVGVEADGEPGRNFVACTITGSDLQQNAADPKEFCRQKYGPDVVVHVPIPAGALSCDPPTDGMFAHTCSNEPWVVTQAETEEPDKQADCCRLCTIGQACGDSCVEADDTCRVGDGCACQG